MKKKPYRAYVAFDFASAPFPPEILVGQVRRLADEFGRPGIEAKRRQKNTLVIPRGYLKTRWPTRAHAVNYELLVIQVWGPYVRTWRTKLL